MPEASRCSSIDCRGNDSPCCCQRLGCRWLMARPSWAQFDPGSDSAANGVIVDADGVLHRQTSPIHRPTPTRPHCCRTGEARRGRGHASKLRKVSLNRLERAIAAQMDKNQPPTDEMLLSGRSDSSSIRLLLPRDQGHRPGRPGRRWVEDDWPCRESNRAGRCWSCKTWSSLCEHFRQARKSRR